MVCHSPVAKCYSCGWEGADEGTIEEPAALQFYDILMKDSFKGAEVTRSNQLCPVCRSIIRSRRSIDGVPMDR